MFTRLLVPLDGSALAECVLPHVAALARPGATVLLVQVLVSEPGGGPVDPLDWRLRRDAAALYLERVGARLGRDAPVRVTTLVAEGCAPERILAIAKEASVDVVVLSSHGAGGLSPWNLGSVPFKVTQRSGVSLLLVRGYRHGVDARDAPAGGRFQRILVPLDGSLRGEHVLPSVGRLAGRHSAHLDLAHVVTVPDDIERLSGPGRGDQDATAAQGRAERYLHELTAELGPPCPVSAHVLRDRDEYSALEDLVDQLGIDLVVLSAHGHSGKRRRSHGSLTTSFLLHASASVLVLNDMPWQELLPGAAERALGGAELPRHAAGPPGQEHGQARHPHE